MDNSEIKYYDTIINDLAKSLMMDYTQNGTFLRGMSGIGYALLKAYIYTDKEIYLSHAAFISQKIDRYTFKHENLLYTYGPSFANVGVELGYGITGIAYFEKELRRILEAIGKVDM